MRPLVRVDAPGVTLSAGAAARITGILRAGIELAWSNGGEPAGLVIPEGSRAGNRTLVSCLANVEVVRSSDGRGFFASVGAGIGRSTLEGARGVFEPPYGENWLIPTRETTLLAGGAGAGYRTTVGPGDLGFQFALRTHALFDGTEIPASAWALTFGLVY